MYELDREKFGSFIARLRKEKGYTQKELAEKLSISDKAVSKWETVKSLPDISLLVPLADIMEVTVTELLEARRIEGTQITAVPVEDMVKKALTYSEEIQKKNTRQKVKHCILCGAGIMAGLLEILGLVLLTKDTDFLSRYSSVFGLEGLSILFGIYFWIFAKEKIPSFYDENKLNFYSDGIFRINMPGLHFNNRNWPYIVRVSRLGMLALMILCPLVYFILYFIASTFSSADMVFAGQFIILLIFLGSVFIPLYVVGKKYE